MALIIKQYPDLSQPYLFYGGTESLRFSKKIWTWFKEHDGGTLEPLSGVTGTCKIIDHSAPLMVWAVKMALQRAHARLQEHKRADGFYEVYEEELAAILVDAKKADREVLEDAGNVGHIAHAWIESYIQSILAKDNPRSLEILAKWPEDERAANCCIAAVEWMFNHKVEWLQTERKVYSREFKYAGTMDGLAIVSACENPRCCAQPFTDRLSIVDWKTSNHLYAEYLLQTAAYQQAYMEETAEAVQDRWILRLGKDDAEFDPWHAAGAELFLPDFTGFRHALNLSLTMKQIDRRIWEIRDRRRGFERAEKTAAKEAAHRIACPKSKDYLGSRLTKCFEDGTQCEACASIYKERHR